MNAMFQNLKLVISLDLSKFNTSKVTDMYAMFKNCNNLIELDLSKFET